MTSQPARGPLRDDTTVDDGSDTARHGWRTGTATPSPLAGLADAPRTSRGAEEFSKFYLECVPKLVAFLISNGASLADAADCAQETLIEAMPPVWATLEFPYAWCRTVAYRKSCDLKARRRESPHPELDRAGSSLVAPDTDIAEFEQQLEFQRQLARLGSDKQRTVLTLTYDGASPKEIAEILQMEPSTVRSTLRHAREALRKLEAQEGGQRD